MAAVAAAAASLTAAACINVTGSTCAVEQSDYHNLTFGVAASDSLTSKTCIAFYKFSVGAQTNLRVTLTSPGIQTFLQVSDSTGVIRVNSVLSTALDTTTTVRMMLGAGGYQIFVVPYHEGQRAQYTLLAVTDTSAVGGCGAVWVTPGITTTQTISHADCTQGPGGSNSFTHVYGLLLRSGQSVVFSEHSTSLAPGMTLTGPDGTEPSTADSLGTTALLTTTVGSQGAYRLWVGSTSAGQVGSYTLQIQ
ncbi:MAG TPA: hypothetical protein VMT21_10690 [Gemmatimonadales bacterium]|nr:hypothetical protein [Gemmatimonadales bacterium]